jgi:ArsR family transcriptional regulator, arsenate/arsenite/antimonite-responsive transcriptional repressor
VTNRRDSELAKQLWAVGDPVRLRILRLLPPTPACEHENNVSALAQRLGLSQPTISHHLRVLRQAGLVSFRKMCRDVYYWVEPETAAAMLEDMQAVFADQTAAAKKLAQSARRRTARQI